MLYALGLRSLSFLGFPQKIVERFPECIRAWDLFGWTLLELDEDEKARDAFERAIEPGSRWAGAYIGLGVACRRLGDYETARENCLKAIELEPDNAAAFGNLAFV